MAEAIKDDGCIQIEGNLMSLMRVSSFRALVYIGVYFGIENPTYEVLVSFVRSKKPRGVNFFIRDLTDITLLVAQLSTSHFFRKP